MIYEDYKELARIGVKYYKDTNFCTVVALAVAAGIGFGAAFHTYRRLGRRLGTGTNRDMQEKAFREHGLKLEHIPDCLKTVNQAEQTLKSRDGIYLVYSTGHVSAVKNGTMYDWAAGGSRKRVRCIYRVTAI